MEPEPLADKRPMKWPVLLFCAVLALAGAPALADRATTVFAAASLAGTLDEIAATYPAPVTLAYGGSGVMARQVAAGAPADVVILANTVWMDWLVSNTGLAQDSPRAIAGNRLVVIAPSGSAALKDPATLPARLGTGRLAMGHRDGVPAGVYARQWMQQAGLWQTLEPRLAETDNVRAALALVARAQSPFGVVYLSDAQASTAVEVIYTIPENSHDPIRYLAAALTPKGAGLLSHLSTADAAAIFSQRGFAPVTP